MKKWLKRVRGAIGMGLTWAAAWLGLTAFTAVWWIGLPVMYAVQGFIGGVVFSTVLGIVERRKRLDEMSLPRFAAWGAVGGLAAMWLIMGGMNVSLAGMAISASLSALAAAGCATGSLALARRAEKRALLDTGAELDEVGLTASETQELLGGRL